MFDYISIGMDKSKYSLLLNCGPKELEIFRKIKDDFKDLTNTAENRNEIARRGLTSFKYLIEVDMSVLLIALSNNLKVLYETFEEERFEFAKSLAIATYAAMICKKGTSESELFEPIVLNMKLIDEYKNHHILDADTKEKIRTVIDHVSKSIDIIFLKKTDMHSKFEELESYYERKGIEEFMKSISNTVMIGVAPLIVPASMGFERGPGGNSVVTAATGHESRGNEMESTSSSEQSSKQMIVLKRRTGVANS